MSMTVSVRIEHRTASRAKSQAGHDLRTGSVPKYVFQDRIKDNSVILDPLSPAKLREICLTRRARRQTKRAMKQNTCIASVGIITFGRDAQPIIKAMTVDEQNRLYRVITERIAEALRTNVSGLVVHRDELSPHAHFQMPAFSEDGTPVSKIMTQEVARKIQDIAGEVLKEFGLGEITRGKKKVSKLKDHLSVKDLHNNFAEDLLKQNSDLRKSLQIETAKNRKMVSSLTDFFIKEDPDLFDRFKKAKREEFEAMIRNIERTKKLLAEEKKHLEADTFFNSPKSPTASRPPMTPPGP